MMDTDVGFAVLISTPNQRKACDENIDCCDVKVYNNEFSTSTMILKIIGKYK